MWKCGKVVAGLLVVSGGVALLSPAARASIVINQTDTTTFNGGVSPDGFPSSWPVNPNAGDTTGGAPNSYSQVENNYGSGPPTGGSLGQSIDATATGLLSDIEIMVTGAVSGTTFNLNFYSAGPATAGLAGSGSASYTPGSGGVSLNLLASDSQGLTMPGYNTGGAVGAMIDFNLQGSDGGIPITAGDEYIVEIADPSNSGDLILLRNGATGAAYANGEAFRSESSLNGNSARSFGVALAVAVPEPASIGLVAIAGLGLLARRRSRA